MTRAALSSIYKVKKGQKDKGLDKQNKEKEFKYLKDLIDYNTKYSTRLLSDNELSRYNNIHCYQDNVVEVSTEHKLINASWIHVPLEKSFICTQAPLRNTVDDFWQMCFEHNVNIIIMLCQLREKGKEKCVEYWNLDKIKIVDSSIENNLEFNFEIEFTSEEINKDIIIRNCHVKNKRTNEVKDIKQIHYGGWPDHETPNDIQTVFGNILFMFNIVDNVFHLREKNPNNISPICIHCSAGVGRTGTFIALYNIYSKILSQLNNKNSKTICFSLMNLVRKLKEMRLYLVENDMQYNMIYQFISKLLKDRN